MRTIPALASFGDRGVFGLRLELHIGSPWSPACYLQILGHSSVYNCMSHFLIINSFTYICMYVFIYMYVCINIFMYIYTKDSRRLPCLRSLWSLQWVMLGRETLCKWKKNTMPSSAIDYKRKKYKSNNVICKYRLSWGKNFAKACSVQPP